MSVLPTSLRPAPGHGRGDETMCAVFQRTAREHRDLPALRTLDDSVALTWGEYAQRVERVAGGLAALGVRPGEGS